MNLVLPFLFLLTSNYADSFDCYFTNFDDLDTFDKTVEPVSRDCKNHIVNSIGYIRYSKRGYLSKYLGEDRHMVETLLSHEMNHRCYTIGFEAKFENTTEDVTIQLCDYKDNCYHFFGKIGMLPLLIVSNITCVECYGNLCNSKYVGNEKENSSSGNTSSYRRNLSIGAGGCGVVGGIGTLIRLLCCRKFKNSKSDTV